MVSAFSSAEQYQPVESVDYAGRALAVQFSTAQQEYEAARQRAGLFDRSDRGLIAVTGKDRKSWLHNLVTNAVKTVADGAGTYAFALDVKGRIQFDLNILALAERLWVDVDANYLAAALKHLDRYHISEDVRLADQTAAFARLGVAGPESTAIATRLGVSGLGDMPALSQQALSAGVVLVRHDFAGHMGFELLVPIAAAAQWWDRLAGDLSVTPVGQAALDVLRIEAGIPWMGRDLDEKVVAPETGQLARAVSYNKGCYLGQEVVERMRSHGALPRRLVRLACNDGPHLSLPTPILRENTDVGRVTSLVAHPTEGKRIGLGYLKSAVADGAGLTAGDPPIELQLLPA